MAQITEQTTEIRRDFKIIIDQFEVYASWTPEDNIWIRFWTKQDGIARTVGLPMEVCDRVWDLVGEAVES